MQAGDGQYERSITEDKIIGTLTKKDICIAHLIEQRKLLLNSNWKQAVLLGRSASLRTMHHSWVCDYQVFVVHSKHLLPQR